MRFKENIRVIGIDDAFLDDRYSILIGIIMRGRYVLEGVLSSKIHIDGLDANEKIREMIIGSTHLKQIKVIMLDGITVGGFNLVDIKLLYDETNIPVIAVIKRQPDFDKIYSALENLADKDKRMAIIKNCGDINSFLYKGNKILYQMSGFDKKEDCEFLIKKFSVNSIIPEPIRIAHLVASGITKGRNRRD
ncbi:DUF99 family protein [Candidatus Methanoliparum sp. LAM-1]|uniref:endonuclease dU n=1 Tax=Candidatus Methanoliparum sp. LAM-1 TaxID=2874846 RepID=UPI001E30CABA|nr:DUF99 family protein [Candidatus Methanoliparum sp. LAM-1]BDC36357.1 hypothetical protein MTLP_10390 [Candidatus Methanoliparum sp. LAM-1]